MPISRKRKKKKVNKPKRQPSLEELKTTMLSKGMAPNPIQLKYFEFSLGDTERGTFEERLETVKQMGQKADEQFPGKYKEIQQWFQRYDQLYLLAFCCYHFLTSDAGYDEEAVTGQLEFPICYQELLQAFALAQPRSHEIGDLGHEVDRFKADLKKIGTLNAHRHFHFSELVATPADLDKQALRIQMKMHTTAVRNWAYEHQMQHVTLALAEAIAPVFIAKNGFDPQMLLKIIYKMTDTVQERINAHRLKLIATTREKHYEKVSEVYEREFAVQSATSSQRREMWERMGKNLLHYKAMLLAHSDLFLQSIFTFDFDTLIGFSEGTFDKEQLQEIFDHIAMTFGELSNFDAEHFLLGNPVQQKPFIRLNQDEVFSSLWSVLSHYSLGILETFCAKDPSLRAKYNKLRGDYLEDEIEKLFRSSFPMAKIYAGSKWPGKDGRLYENDLLVIIDKFAIVVEGKAGMVSPPAKRAAPERLFKTLQELVEEPSEQALRFIEYLKDNPRELSLKVEKGPNNRIDATHLKYFIPLGVTLSHLGAMGTNLKQLIKAGVVDRTIAQLAPSISLTDLQNIFDLLPMAAEKIHYLQRRREIEATITYTGDELDLLGWYMDNGFNLGTVTEKIGLFRMDLKSKELDNYIIGSALKEKVRKPELKKTNWWRDMLLRMEEKQTETWLETSYVLLNVSLEIQEHLELMLKDLEKKLRQGKAPQVHNWILLETADKDRKFFIAGYQYQERYREERNGVINDIFDDERMKGAKGRVVIGRNIDKDHYPYSVLVSWLDPQLFDNEYLGMVAGSYMKAD